MAVSLEELLAAREARAAYQRTLLEGTGLPLISLTVNMPGPQKDGDRADMIFRAGVLAVRERLAGSIRYIKLKALPTGHEGFFVVDMAAVDLKAITCEIETAHPLGRLLDIDVLDTNGQLIGRESIGQPPRGCLICGLPGPGCARSRAHSLEALHVKIDTILSDWKTTHG